LKEIGVVADFTKLHQEIEIIFFFVFRGVSVLKEVFVNFELEISESHVDKDFFLWGEVFLDLGFCAAEHKGFEDFVELANHL
jgi:hypothetical protein